ncbi:hypothetical protein M2263_001856 [Providencia alcalifaciens]|nr:hypothetical protein [Providencia alcalifaciens]
MTPSTLPNKLWRSLGEIKRYVEKMPEGVPERDLKNKVSAFGALNGKERLQLVEFLESRESILVLRAIKHGNKKPTNILRHKKYGYPKSIDGYEYPIQKKQKTKTCSRCKTEKPLTDFHVNNTKNDGRQSYCKECDIKHCQSRDWTSGDNYGKKLTIKKPIEGENMTNPSSPEQLRKQAEELLKAAEQAEKNQATEKWKTEFKKEFEQQKLEVMQAVGMVNRKFDELMDAVSSLGKASEKFKLLKIE